MTTSTFLFDFNCYNAWDCVLSDRSPVTRWLMGEKMTCVCCLCIMRSHVICTPHKILLGDEDKKKLKGRVSGKLGGGEVVRFGMEN